MKRLPLIHVLFLIAALYDGVLGLLFLLFPRAPFEWFDGPPPDHYGYLRFSAALLLVFASMFAAIAMDPVRRREQIIYGILLKLSYCGVVVYYWITTDVPTMWKPFVIFDALFLIAFLWAYSVVRAASTITAESVPSLAGEHGQT